MPESLMAKMRFDNSGRSATAGRETAIPLCSKGSEAVLGSSGDDLSFPLRDAGEHVGYQASARRAGVDPQVQGDEGRTGLVEPGQESGEVEDRPGDAIQLKCGSTDASVGH